MKNKIKLKKHLKLLLFIILVILFLFISLNIYEYSNYTKNYNNKIIEITNTLLKEYPGITEEEIIKILNTKNNKDNTLNKYGIDINKESIILENNNLFKKYLIINTITLILSISLILFVLLHYNRKKDIELKEITNYLKELNNKNYKISVDSMSEDELSILKNEIYKTTIMLKETLEIQKNDKINLKNSLEDISHQLKTPLTSILIMLDNLIDNTDIDINTKNEFLREIKREIININFLINSLLKLSKFDANTIKFTQKEIEITDLINESVKNVSLLCDLKNVKINILNNTKILLNCDLKWQIEAITNILKNCIEYSKENSTVEINYNTNPAYTFIEIKDFGKEISESEINHIFERFYKGESSSEDSIGIGLSLSKSIIEKDNGKITVTSNKKETTFMIKYFK